MITKNKLSKLKKLYSYYCKSMISGSKSFWFLFSVGILVSLMSVIITKKADVMSTKIDNESMQYLDDLTKSEQSVMFFNDAFLSTKIDSFNAFSFVLRNDQINSFHSLFLMSLVYFLFIHFFYGTFNVGYCIRSLLSKTMPKQFWQKSESTGEDEMVLTFTTGITRRMMVISKFLAYLTRCLIINFVTFVLPYLLCSYNWVNYPILLFKFFMWVGMFFPMLFFATNSLFFFWVNINEYLVMIIGFLFFIGTNLSFAFGGEEGMKKFTLFLQNFMKGYYFPYFVIPLASLFSLLFFYLHSRNFEITDFS